MVIILITIISSLLTIAFFTIAERKLLASIQRRRGPNVTNIYGILRAFADGLKLLLKETIIPSRANWLLFLAAPSLALIVGLTCWAFIPFNELNYTLNFDYSLLLLYAISSLGVYGIVGAGWSSNSKYALLGSLRSTAQLISYEVSIMLQLLPIMALANSCNIIEIVEKQRTVWFIAPMFPIFIIFFISVLAETNRAPFDLPETEGELVAGFSIEHAPMAFAMFFGRSVHSRLCLYCDFWLDRCWVQIRWLLTLYTTHARSFRAWRKVLWTNVCNRFQPLYVQGIVCINSSTVEERLADVQVGANILPSLDLWSTSIWIDYPNGALTGHWVANVVALGVLLPYVITAWRYIYSEIIIIHELDLAAASKYGGSLFIFSTYFGVMLFPCLYFACENLTYTLLGFVCLVVGVFCTLLYSEVNVLRSFLQQLFYWAGLSVCGTLSDINYRWNNEATTYAYLTYGTQYYAMLTIGCIDAGNLADLAEIQQNAPNFLPPDTVDIPPVEKVAICKVPAAANLPWNYGVRVTEIPADGPAIVFLTPDRKHPYFTNIASFTLKSGGLLPQNLYEINKDGYYLFMWRPISVLAYDSFSIEHNAARFQWQLRCTADHFEASARLKAIALIDRPVAGFDIEKFSNFAKACDVRVPAKFSSYPHINPALFKKWDIELPQNITLAADTAFLRYQEMGGHGRLYSLQENVDQVPPRFYKTILNRSGALNQNQWLQLHREITPHGNLNTERDVAVDQLICQKVFGWGCVTGRNLPPETADALRRDFIKTRAEFEPAGRFASVWGTTFIDTVGQIYLPFIFAQR